ncbi:MAG: type II toxin-antitoxin system PemK/MazF family toxin [Candidatus Kapaibacteriota bacterium]
MVNDVRRGNIILVDFNPIIGSEQAGMRPAIVVQIDKANIVSPCTIVAPCTTKIRYTLLPSHVALSAGEGNLPQDSIVLCEQIRTIDKRRIVKVYGHCADATMSKLNTALATILGLVV